MLRFKDLVLLTILTLSTACSQKTTIASFLDAPSAAPAKTPNHSAQVKFKKLKLPSLDAALTEIANLDGTIVTARNNLKNSRQSIHSLHNGDMKKLRNEIANLAAKGVFQVSTKDGLPHISYNKKKGNARALTVFQAIENTETLLRATRKKYPTLEKDLQQLKKKGKTAAQKAPEEAQEAISNGKMPPKELNNTLLKAKSNMKKMKLVPVHLNELKEEISLASALLRKLF